MNEHHRNDPKDKIESSRSVSYFLWSCGKRLVGMFIVGQGCARILRYGAANELCHMQEKKRAV